MSECALGSSARGVELARAGADPTADRLARGRDETENAVTEAQPGPVRRAAVGDPETHPLEQVAARPATGVGQVDGAGLGPDTGHRGLEDDVQDPVEVVGAGQRVAEPGQVAAQLVAAVLQGADRSAQLAGHLVEGAGQLSDLVAATQVGDRGVEVAVGDAPGGKSELGQRPGRDPGQLPAEAHSQDDRRGEHGRQGGGEGGHAQAGTRRHHHIERPEVTRRHSTEQLAVDPDDMAGGSRSLCGLGVVGGRRG